MAKTTQQVVLIPSEQGKYSNIRYSAYILSYYVLIPSEQGKYSNALLHYQQLLVSVLIPSEQGKYSNPAKWETVKPHLCLNPFGTGKVFKRYRDNNKVIL